jgi:ABC-type multidrug transport system fused ATPase/permease subunit
MAGMKNPYISLLRSAWKYARSERKKLILVYLMFVGANVIFSMQPLLLGWFVNKAQTDTSRVLHFAFIYIGAYITLKLLEWSLHGPARIYERTLAFTISRNFIREKYHQVLHLSPKWHQDHHSGETINRIRKAYESLREFFDRGFTNLYTLTKFIFSVTAIIYFSPLFGSIAVVMGMATVFTISRFDATYIKTLREMNQKEHDVSSNLFDSLSNIRTVITLRLERSMESGLLKKIRRVFRPFRRNAIVNEWKWFTAEMMITLIYGVIVIGYIYQHWTPGQVFKIGGLVTLLGYITQFTSVFQNVAIQYTTLVQYHTNVNEVQDITDAYVKQHPVENVQRFPRKWSTVHISNLNFSHRSVYEEEFIPQSLHNIRLKIGKGKKIALIGHSGSGKSTLLSLLRGLYPAQAGIDIRIDGTQYAVETLHEKVTQFPQEPEIFENTIEYNITMGLPATEDEIRKACEIAGFNEVINQLPHGLQTDIKEKGVNISGGQKQRLALARGILAAKDSEIILLDEPTSNVDPKTEAMIYERLFAFFADKAFVSSMHRLHLLDQFDYIYILEKGKVVDEGSFDELIARNANFIRFEATNLP